MLLCVVQLRSTSCTKKSVDVSKWRTKSKKTSANWPLLVITCGCIVLYSSWLPSNGTFLQQQPFHKEQKTKINNSTAPGPENFFLVFKGTTYHGSWDGHYGPSGRAPDYPSYDLSGVLESPAAQALTSIKIPLPGNETILALRAATDLKCGPPPKDYTPCHLTESVCLFNIQEDPCELNNLAFKYPSAVKLMDQTLQTYRFVWGEGEFTWFKITMVLDTRIRWDGAMVRPRGEGQKPHFPYQSCF